jgi:hypothetical protein
MASTASPGPQFIKIGQLGKATNRPVRSVSKMQRTLRDLQTGTRIKQLLAQTGAHVAFSRTPFRWGVVILLYHRVGPPVAPWLLRPTPRDIFDEEMAHIRRHYDVLSLEDAIAYLRGWDKGPRRGVVVTFDDGYSDNYHHALPSLVRHRIPATIFLATRNISDRRLFWPDRLRYAAWATRQSDDGLFLRQVSGRVTDASRWSDAAVDNLTTRLAVDVPEEMAESLLVSWAQVREMAEAGISFGGHSRNHSVLVTLAAADRWGEIVGSLSDLAANVSLQFRPFAYPFGLFDAELEQMCEAAGYHCALTCQEVATTTDPSLYRIGRLEADSAIVAFRRQVAGMPTGLPGFPGRNSQVCKSVWRPRRIGSGRSKNEGRTKEQV